MDIQTILIIGVLTVVVVAVVIFGKKSNTPSASSSTEQDIQDAISNGNKVQAIKHYRYVHGVGLKEAKEAVEKMQSAL